MALLPATPALCFLFRVRVGEPTEGTKETSLRRVTAL